VYVMNSGAIYGPFEGEGVSRERIESLMVA